MNKPTINKLLRELIKEELDNATKTEKIDDIIARLQETQNKILSVEEDLNEIANALSENEIGSSRHKFDKRIGNIVQYFNTAVLKYGPFKGKGSPIMRVIASLEKIKESLDEE